MKISRVIAATRRHARDESGTSLIEYTVVVILFLLIFFAILDFGRLGFNWVMTEKAMQRAARIATVRPPVCGGVPDNHTINASTPGADAGWLCRAGGCTPVATRVCLLGEVARTDDRNGCATMDMGDMNGTAVEIWSTICPILPLQASPRNIWVSYAYDPQLGFAGGPYTPIVEVGVVTAAVEASLGDPADELRFQFITPIPALAVMAAGGGTMSNFEDDDSNSLADIPFPDMSVSLPGEDLNIGSGG